MDFTNKVVVVTGAGGDMGTAIVKKIYRPGAKAVILDIREDLARKTLETAAGCEHGCCMAADVSNEESVKETVKKIVRPLWPHRCTGQSGRYFRPQRPHGGLFLRGRPSFLR